jgi:hypothetical protein
VCSCNDHQSDLPPWLRPLCDHVRKHREAFLAFAALLAIVAGLLVLANYFFGPTDIDRAESAVEKAWAALKEIEDDSSRAGKEAHRQEKRAAEFRKVAEEEADSTDTARVEWLDSSARSLRQLSKAYWERRDNCLHLAAEYRRLLAEAECEVLRAKNARDRGTPYKVTPRVREILTPILAAH